jgi:murein tripeptide amidase MpaA
LFDHLGVFTYTIELWDMPTEAGIKDRKFIDWFREHPHEEDLQILEWADRHGGPDAFVNWYPFEHPQLGKVELGGWNSMYTWRNPPVHLLGAEAARNTPFALALCDMLPRLDIFTLEVTPLGDGDYHVNLVVENLLPPPARVNGKNKSSGRFESN